MIFHHWLTEYICNFRPFCMDKPTLPATGEEYFVVGAEIRHFCAAGMFYGFCEMLSAFAWYKKEFSG